MLANYLPILLFLTVATLLAGVLLALGTVIGRLNLSRRDDSEKLTPYECGFDAFEDSRAQFDVRYYLVAILFIVFDLETALLVPFAVGFKGLPHFAWVAVLGIFLPILVVGFIYEWGKGALEWD
jgi:NADH-quinone oxidoreductase subunit A